ncbi:MAG: small multi-drug export protein [Thermoplasmata archaeon]|nr:small multi-drug export protein [Thermoplasmata archaeon]
MPDWLITIIISMSPWIELRGAIPVAILEYHWQWWQALPISVLGNMIPVPFILLLFRVVEKELRKNPTFNKLIDKLFDKTRKKANTKVEKYEELALILFVAIPLPFTGAWTASLIAYLFNLDIKKSILTIFLGVIIAGLIVTILTITGKAFL